MRFIKSSIIILSSLLLLFAACEGPTGPEGPQGEEGPEGPIGSEGPTGPAGEDGNANVTLYILDGHDFSDSANLQRYLDIVESSEEVTQSQWTAYLVTDSGVTYQMPGLGFNGVSEYRSYHQYSTVNNGSLRLNIMLEDGPGEEYGAVHLFRVEASEVDDLSSGSMTLDLDDYDKIMEYGKKNSMETRFIMDR